MIKAVLFDFDGTLANTMPGFIKAYNRALTKIGFKLSESEIAKKCYGQKEATICDYLGAPEKLLEFKEAYFSAKNDFFKQSLLYPESINILEFLKSKEIKVGIITFAYRWYIDQMINQYDIGKYFDYVLSFDDVKNSKPHPEAVLKSCEKFQIKPEEALVVGDSKSDILMGNTAGSKTVLFNTKEHDLFYSLEELKKSNPTFIINNLLKIKEINF